MKILNSKLHGIIDYGVVIFLMLSPAIFGLSSLMSTLTYLLGGIHLILTITTNFQYGVIKIVPLKIHGIIELMVGAVLLISPLVLGSFTETPIDKYFFSGFGIAVLLTWAISDYSHKG